MVGWYENGIQARKDKNKRSKAKTVCSRSKIIRYCRLLKQGILSLIIDFIQPGIHKG